MKRTPDFVAAQSDRAASLPGSCSIPNYLNPRQVATMWGIFHDKVLEFIRTGELNAFNVASKNSRRPQFKITLDAVKAFELLRAGGDPSRMSPPAPRRTVQNRSAPQQKQWI